MAVNVAQRRLAPFPQAPEADYVITAADCLQNLTRPGSVGLILYGGPGSGTTNLLAYLAAQMGASNGRISLGPFNMSLYQGQTNPERIWLDLAKQMVARLETAGIVIPQADRWERDLTTTAVLDLVGDALRAAEKTGIRRMILLLDDFDDIHPRAAVNIANLLRALYDAHKQYFSFMLVAASDLEMLRTTRHVYSPLEGVSQSFQLLDLEEKEVFQQAHDSYSGPGQISDVDLDDIWYWTQGYPTLVNALVKSLSEERQSQPDFTVNAAVEKCQDNYPQVEPLKTAVREMEHLANLNARGFNPAQLLDNLVRGELPASLDDRGTRMLLAMGILGWRADRILTWRNEFVRTFWSEHESGKRLLANWVRRPSWYQQSELSAQGQIFVNLFMDLGFFLQDETFDWKRGTQEWTDALRKLPEVVDATNLFKHWKDQQRLVNIGSDLNIFHGNTIYKSFMPIYEAPTSAFEGRLDFACEKLLARLEGSMDAKARQNARELIKEEWRRWQNVRVQLTRDGAVHITLVREINDPLPLMQIMHELLGLERELEGRQIMEVSVQWELALIAVMAFFEQIVGPNADIPALDVVWRGVNPPETAVGIYPLRDRYVTYLLQKVCNCRFEGLRPLRERRIINMDNLDDLQHSNQIDETLQTPFNYARELSTLLEGVMIGRVDANDHGERSGYFPPLTLREIQHFLNGDLSSWRNEYAGTTLDNALLIFQTQQKLLEDGSFARQQQNNDRPAAQHSHAGESTADDWCQVCQQWEHRNIEDIYFPQRKVAYADYWQCLVLGLAYVVELRWSAQWIAWRTTDRLDRLAYYREDYGGNLPPDELEDLVHTVSLTTRLLAHLRDAAIPMFMTGADYAARKYQRLIEVSGLLQAIQNSEENITALNTYLNYVEQQAAMERTESLSNIINWAGILLAMIAFVVAIPSMWVDFGGEGNHTSIVDGLRQGGIFEQRPGLLITLFVLTLLIIIAAIGLLILLWQERKKMKRRSSK